MKEVISKKEMGVSRHSSIILGLLFLVIQGCAGVGPDLEKAKEQNTEQAYLEISKILRREIFPTDHLEVL